MSTQCQALHMTLIHLAALSCRPSAQLQNFMHLAQLQAETTAATAARDHCGTPCPTSPSLLSLLGPGSTWRKGCQQLNKVYPLSSPALQNHTATAITTSVLAPTPTPASHLTPRTSCPPSNNNQPSTPQQSQETSKHHPSHYQLPQHPPNFSLRTTRTATTKFSTAPCSDPATA